jgi:hypothetical protein
MAKRNVTDAPFGSPEASTVKVYRIDPETGEKVHVGEEDPWDSELAEGTTLAGARISGVDPVAYMDGQDTRRRR